MSEEKFPTQTQASIADAPDYSDEVAVPSEDGLARLRRLALKMLELESDIETAETVLEDLKKEFKTHSQTLVPTLMQELGLDEIKITGGSKIVVAKALHASLPQDPDPRHAVWMQYLTDSGNDALMKRQVIMNFGKESTEYMKTLMTHLRDLDVVTHATIVEKADIHNQTLLAFLRRELSDGHLTEKQLEAFGAIEQTYAKIETKKRKG